MTGILRDQLSGTGNFPIILGGDWNCTPCTTPARENPDVINMNSIPNKRHSKLLIKLCDEFDLCEPYQTLHPNFTEYMNVYMYLQTPLKKNRSRNDFFIVSKALAGKVTECEILPALQNKLFDHKGISLSFKNKNKPITVPIISNSVLKDPETDFVVGLVKTYINYSTTITEEDRIILRLGCGHAWSSIRAAGPRNVFAAPGDRTELEELTREAKIADVREFFEFFPFDDTRDGTLSIEDDIFMECLLDTIKH